MRRFLLLWLAVAASADQLGYNYQPLGHDTAFGGAAGTGYNVGSLGGFGATAGGFNGGYDGFTGGNTLGGGNSRGVAQLSQPISPVAEYQKEFYSYSAPEEEFNDIEGSQQIAGMLKKNLRVVFIRAPENQGLANAALQLAKQSSQDRTAIYVLSKQADVGDLASRLQAIKSGNSQRPEVHFVKYRTPEDAARAQQSIQSQYDALSGPSRSTNEGAAPVLNFASPSAGIAHQPSAGGAVASTGFGGGGAVAPPATSYLPPILRFK